MSLWEIIPGALIVAFLAVTAITGAFVLICLLIAARTDDKIYAWLKEKWWQ